MTDDEFRAAALKVVARVGGTAPEIITIKEYLGVSCTYGGSRFEMTMERSKRMDDATAKKLILDGVGRLGPDHLKGQPQ